MICFVFVNFFLFCFVFDFINSASVLFPFVFLWLGYFYLNAPKIR